jgi:predicted secreted protein
MAKINGTKVKILVGGVAISNLTNVKMSIGANMIDVTTKDSAGWKEVLPGLKNASMSGDAIVDFSATNIPPSTIFTTYLSVGASVAVIFYDGTPPVLVSHTAATGYFDKLDYNGELEGNFTFSFSVTITAAVTQVAST